MRILPALAALLLLSAPAFGDNHQRTSKVANVPEDNRLPGHEPDTYRFGLPYNTYRGTTPGQCEQMCNRDDSCAAWTLAPATFSMGPRCELKRSIGSSEYRPGATSGIAFKYQPTPPRRAPAYTPAPREVRRVAPPPAVRQPVQPITTAPRTAIRAVPRPAPVATVRGSGPELRGGPTPTQRVVVPVKPAPRPVTTTTRPAPTPAPAPAARPQPVQRPMPQPQQTAPQSPPPGPPPPTRATPQFQMQPAVPQPAPSPQPQPTQAPAIATAPSQTPTSGGVQIDPPPPAIKPRRPWTERMGSETDYSVGELEFIPGDEEATAGIVTDPAAGE